MEVKTSLADLKKLPYLKSNLETQLLFGEKIQVICDKNESWFPRKNFPTRRIL